MARKKKSNVYKGVSVCKSDCSGHRAGARYARSGGSEPSPHSPSFNKGMRVELGTFRRGSR
jgi:hypothetical protein